MPNVQGIILAYENRPEMKELTQNRTASSIPYGGKYRLIDFALSNLENAGITNVGVVVEDNYRSLLDHIGSGRDWDMNRKNGGMMILPPMCFGHSSYSGALRGKLDALVGVMSYINSIKAKYTVLLDGDIIANIDMAKAIDQHIDTEADITIIASRAVISEKNVTFLEAGEDNRVNAIRIGAKNGNGVCSLRAMVINTDLLKKIVKSASELGQSNLTRDVLQQNVQNLKIYCFEHEGYAAAVDDASDYYRRSMDLLTPEVRRSLFRPERPILTKVRDETSAYYGPDSLVSHSLLADGCYVEGTVKNSIIFRGVRIEKGAVVENSILMQGACVEKNAKIQNVIADKDTVISAGTELKGHEGYPFCIAKGTKI